MDVFIREASFNDMAQFSYVVGQAFHNDSLIGGVMHPYRKDYPHDMELWAGRNARADFWDYRTRFLLAVRTGENGKEVVIGCAQWQRIGKAKNDMDLRWFDPRALLKPMTTITMRLHAIIWPNRAADPDKIDILERAHPFYEHMWSGDREESWYLHILGVHPEYQGHGVGRKLVQWGLDRAQSEGVCASVMAAKGKDGFYQKCGYTIQDGSGGMGEGNPLSNVEGGNMWWTTPSPEF